MVAKEAGQIGLMITWLIWECSHNNLTLTWKEMMHASITIDKLYQILKAM